jgi:hypothetical protein
VAHQEKETEVINLTEDQIAAIVLPGYEVLPVGDGWVKGTKFLLGRWWRDTNNVQGNETYIHIRPIGGRSMNEGK